MSATKVDGRRLLCATSRKDDALIARAAKRTSLAGSALKSAAGDLRDAHGDDGNALAGVADVVLEQAVRVSHLAEDIESHRPVQVAGSKRAAASAERGRT